MTTTNDPLTDTTAALMAHTERMLEEARQIKSPRELGITPDTRRNGQRPPRRSQRRRFIR